MSPDYTVMDQNSDKSTAFAEDLHNLPRVEQTMRSLTKLIHGRKLYADNNPRLVEFSTEFEAAVNSYFRDEEVLVLGIDQHTIRWRDQVVYSNEKREESIAFLLHRDGVGEITIEKNAVDGEIGRLVQILTEEYHSNNSSEDVVTKFWNADFDHIRYRVLDDYLSVQYGEQRPSESDQVSDKATVDQPEILPSLEDKGRVIVQRSDAVESIYTFLNRLIMKSCSATDPDGREAHFQDMVSSLFSISSEELGRYHSEYKRELRGDGLAEFIETVFVFTLLHDNPSAVRDVADVIERMIDYVVEEGSAYTMGRVLTHVQQFRKEHGLHVNVSALCGRIEDKLTEDSVIQILGEKLKFWNRDSEKILAYFTIVGEPVIDPLLKVLHNVDGEKLHKEICDVLIAVSGKEITDVIEKLDVDAPAVAFDAVYLANKIKASRMSPKLQELLYYPDVNVKRAMLEVVARIDDRSSVDMLLVVLGDEDKSIRMRAMEVAISKSDDRLRERFSEIAFGKDLSERDPDEREMIFGVLGRVGNAETVASLRKFAEKKSLVNFGKTRENKCLAIRALEKIESPAAMVFLEKLASDSNELVRTRAKRACDMLANRLKENRAKGPKEGGNGDG
jgi:hypothetical protein